jgi:hypothetical protein
VITRGPDVTGPALAWIAPTAAISVDATVSSYKVQVKATDPSGVDSVVLQGVKASNDSGAYWSSTVFLPSPNGVPVKIVAKAWDKRRNQAVDSTSVALTRNVPSGTDKPALTLLQPSSNLGNTLPFASDALHVVYKITDLVALDTTTILFGSVVPKRLTDSTWAADVPVPPTGQPTTLLIQAGNANKLSSVDQIVVTRAKDTVPPILSITSPSKDTVVPYGTTSVTIATSASDAESGLMSVMVGSLPVDATSKVTVALAAGVNSIRVIAKDNAGNADTALVKVTVRDDVTPPTLSITSPSKDTAVPYGTAEITIATSASDAESGLMSVRVGGNAVDATGKATVALVVGSNTIAAIAKDNAGNSTTVKVNVTVSATP